MSSLQQDTLRTMG